MINITINDMYIAAEKVANQIKIDFAVKIQNNEKINVYPIPRGGIPCSFLIKHFLPNNIWILDNTSENTVDAFIDDLIDSGSTRLRYTTKYPNSKFYALFDKSNNPNLKDWLSLPYEKSDTGIDMSADDIVIRLLEYLNVDMSDPYHSEHLKSTPRRFLNAWSEYCKGYNFNPKQILNTSFVEGTSDYGDQMIIVDGIEFNSHCIHHLSPFFGHAHIAYVPNKKIVGLSKIPKTVDMFANRLQVQEVLTTQIADAINSVLEPKGVAVVLEGHHTCCSTRGAKKKARMITSSMRGVFMENISTRNEFLSLIKMR